MPSIGGWKWRRILDPDTSPSRRVESRDCSVSASPRSVFGQVSSLNPAQPSRGLRSSRSPRLGGNDGISRPPQALRPLPRSPCFTWALAIWAVGVSFGFLFCVWGLYWYFWIILACVRGFYDEKGGHFNEPLKTQVQEGRDIFSCPLINNEEPIHLNVVSNKKRMYC